MGPGFGRKHRPVERGVAEPFAPPTERHEIPPRSRRGGPPGGRPRRATRPSRIEARAFARVADFLAAERATTLDVQWLIRRAFCRGVAEPAMDVFWQPQAIVLKDGDELHYQPQARLSDGRLLAFEALLRWRHPVHGLVPPADFIPLAEEIGFIVPLGEWVLRSACAAAAAWPGALTVAVNVSALQLEDGARLQRAVAAALAAAGLPATRLEIEITESALAVNGGQAAEVLHALRSTGVRVSMDDFGTGYSSLSYLRSFPFDKVKIDRSFIRDLPHDRNSMAIVRAIVGLSDTFGLLVTAEGVETEEQAVQLAQDGCAQLQGYLFSRPIPVANVPGLIEHLAGASRRLAPV